LLNYRVSFRRKKKEEDVAGKKVADPKAAGAKKDEKVRK
jgi:hypothetical protein